MMMANTLPMAGTQTGTVAGILRPISRPVTAAEKSFRRIGFFISRCQRYSLSTAQAVDTSRIHSALRP